MRLIRGGARNFCLGGSSYNTNIFIKTTSYTHINTYAFFYYTHTFLFDKLYIYTHPTKKELNIFKSKLCLMAIFHKINKIHFHNFPSEILKKFHFI